MSENEIKFEPVGRYQLKKILGKGSTGTVYLAEDPRIGRHVAIKVLYPTPGSEFNSDRSASSRFLTEARTAGRLRHASIVTIFEADLQGHIPYLVMEYINGKTLDEIIKSGTRFDLRRLAPLLTQIASAIDHAHANSVLHRDIKPGNIIVDEKDHAFVLDFGVAKLHEEVQTHREGVKPTVQLGTPAYMSPEQILNEPLNGRTDLFALAIVAFECLTGVRPFPGDTFATVATTILEAPPLKIQDLRPDLPSGLDDVFAKALAKKKEDRFGSGQEFLVAFQAASAANVVVAVPRVASAVSSVLPKANKVIRGMSLRSIVSGVVAGLCALCVLAWILNSPDDVVSSANRPDALSAEGASSVSSANEIDIVNALKDARARRAEQAVPLAEQLLEHPAFLVRIEALKTIAELGDSSASPQVATALTDADPLVRGFAAKALGKLGGTHVADVLQQRLSTEQTPEVKLAIEAALQKLGLPAVRG